MKKLCVLYMSNNLIKDWGEHVLQCMNYIIENIWKSIVAFCKPWNDGSVVFWLCTTSAEFMKLAELSSLVDLVFVGNPLEEKYSAEGTWIDEATKRVPNLKKLDGKKDGMFFKTFTSLALPWHIQT